MKLKSIKIENFCGIREFATSFNDAGVEIAGPNGCGKTTIANAFAWLLTGKDFEGRSNFGIKTKDSEGNVIPGLDHVVEAQIEINGKESHLKRIYYEVRETVKGSDELYLTGNQTDFEINREPVPKKEFFISKIKNIFHLLSSPFAFNQLHWEERRKLVLDIVGNPEPDVIVSNEVCEYLQKFGFDVGKAIKQVKKDQKVIDDLIRTITIQINECKTLYYDYGVRDNGINNREDELTNNLNDRQNEHAQYQKIIDELEDYKKAKTELIQEKVYQYFAPVSFELFKQNINGEVEQKCEMMLNGRVWSELSTGEKIKAGLHVIKVLQEHYGIELPIFIDHAESLTESGEIDMPEIDSQLIKLKASESEGIEVGYLK